MIDFEKQRTEELKRLVQEALDHLHTLPAEDQAAHWAAQRESFVRAFEPCHHGMVDFEQCTACLDEFLITKSEK